MVSSPFRSLARRSDTRVMTELQILVRRDRALTAELIAHIAEVDMRRLYLARACSSMFVFCRDQLHMAEGVAYKRIRVARAARRFPMLLDKLASGELHLTGAAMLAPVLTQDNHSELLERATHQSKQGISELLAEWFPRPDAVCMIRRLSSTRAKLDRQLELDSRGSGAPTTKAAPSGDAAPQPATTAPRQGDVTPLAPDRYRVQFTARGPLRDKLRAAQALLRHQVPDGDLATILEKALDLLLADVKQRRFGVPRRAKSRLGEPVVTPRPADTRARKSDGASLAAPREVDGAPPTPRHEVTPGAPREDDVTPAREANKRSRHIPAHVRRAVAERDGWQCTFVDRDGRRCTETGFLELHHRHTSFAQGGEHTVDNLALFCRAHNLWEAERDEFTARGVPPRAAGTGIESRLAVATSEPDRSTPAGKSARAATTAEVDPADAFRRNAWRQLDLAPVSTVRHAPESTRSNKRWVVVRRDPTDG